MSTGPQEGRGAGQRDGGKAEPTNFNRKESVHPRELNPGQIAGVLPTDEGAAKGEATVPVRTETREALQRMAEKIDNEDLPAEYRERVREYMESLRRTAGEEAGGEKPGER